MNEEKGPAEMNLLIDSFFTSKWVPEKSGEPDGKGKWITTLIDNPYKFSYHRTRKSDGVIKFRCTGCKNMKGDKKKETYAYAKQVGTDPATGQPIFELTDKETDHTCTPAQSTKWLNKVFLNRCYRAIRGNPIGCMTNMYDKILEEMKVEFFSQDPKDAERTKLLQMEFEQNVRCYR